MRVDPDSLVEDSDGLYFGVRTSTAHRIYAAATEQRKIDGVYPMGLGKTSLPILQGVLELHLEQSETPNISEPTTS